MWFAAIAGLASIRENEIERENARPQVSIDQVILDKQSLLIPNGKISAGPTEGDLNISFTAPNYQAPERLQFRYRLKGFDRDWIEVGVQHQAFYTKLPPGHYVFEVQSADTAGVWNSNVASLEITLKPHFWQTLWFRGLLAWLLLVLAAAMYRIRVRYLVSRNDSLEAKVTARTKELEAAVRVAELAHRALHEQAMKDNLTKIWNRGAIFDILREQVKATRQANAPICDLMVDIDHFKTINDTHGHQIGDDVIREVARRLAALLRADDFAGRYGGEEFLLVLPGCTLTDGLRRGEELRHTIADAPFVLGERTLGVSCSFGVAAGETLTGSDKLVNEADRALYLAKNAGRNRVRGRWIGSDSEIASFAGEGASRSLISAVAAVGLG